MGLIKATMGAIGGTLQDQWKEAIRCEDLTNDVLMMKKTTPTGVITNKSTIIVAPGQCAVIYDNGKIIDATAEEGVYNFDTSSSPSFFAGEFGKTFKEMWERFTYNGETAKEQAVYFFNIKEIIDNKFGTASPIPFQDWSHPIPNEMTNVLSPMRVQIKCYGKYTFKITNPALFMQEIAGIADVYNKQTLVEQMRTEVIAVFQNLVNELGSEKYKVPVLEMPSRTDEIREMMNEIVFDEPIKKRGISILGFSVESVSLDDESKEKIDQYEISSNSSMQKGRLVDAYSQAVEDAANNPNGTMNGFMGIGMMNVASNGMFGAVNNSVFHNENKNIANSIKNNSSSNSEKWTCDCGTENIGNFCSNCGKKKEQKNICQRCGSVNDVHNKFCTNCGTQLLSD